VPYKWLLVYIEKEFFLKIYLTSQISYIIYLVLTAKKGAARATPLVGDNRGACG
jgi:hypothetical protein